MTARGVPPRGVQSQIRGPPVNRQTENITFPHTPCVGSNNPEKQINDISNMNTTTDFPSDTSGDNIKEICVL